MLLGKLLHLLFSLNMHFTVIESFQTVFVVGVGRGDDDRGAQKKNRNVIVMVSFLGKNICVVRAEFIFSCFTSC